MKLPAVLTEGFLQSLPAAERKKLGRAGITRVEAETIFKQGQEKALQRLVWNYLNYKGYYFESDRMDKKTRGKKGRADFRCCVCGAWMSIECKAEGQTLEPEQAKEAAKLMANGGAFIVAYNLQQVIDSLAILSKQHEPKLPKTY